ncbi:hypothetical protein PTI98_004086 [Pleurotus ostreatus]|nr:hypothetical protein PTI98_004086 [Pleurotus ostreatus]
MSRLQRLRLRLGRSLDLPKIRPMRTPLTAFRRQSSLQCQPRPIHIPTRCYNSVPPPPPPPLPPPPLGPRPTNRLLHRADGTPRSKLAGLAIAAAATLAFLLYEALAVIDELDHGIHLLAALLHVQRADYRLFAATDLSDPPQLLRLYRALQAAVNPALEDIYGEVDKLLLLREGDEDGDENAGNDKEVYEEVYEEVCAVLRDACAGVHAILHDPLEEAHELAAAAKIVGLLDQSCAELLGILRRRAEAEVAAQTEAQASAGVGVRDVGERDVGVGHAADSRRRTAGEEVGEAGEEYEVVG